MYANLNDLQKAFLIAVDHKDETLLEKAFNIAYAYRHFGQTHTAINLFEKALDAISEDSRLLHGKILATLGLLSQGSSPEKALNYAKQAMNLLVEEQDYYSFQAARITSVVSPLRTSSQMIAGLESIWEDLQKQQSLGVMTEHRLKLANVSIVWNLAAHYASIGDLDLAEEWWQREANTYTRELLGLSRLVTIISLRARIYALQGKTSEAREVLQDNYRKSLDTKGILHQYFIVGTLFYVEMMDGNIDIAVEMLEQEKQLRYEYGISENPIFHQVADMVINIFRQNLSPVIPKLRDQIAKLGDTSDIDMWLRTYIILFLKTEKIRPSLLLWGYHEAHRHPDVSSLTHLALANHMIAPYLAVPEHQASYEQGKEWKWEDIVKLLEQTLNELE